MARAKATMRSANFEEDEGPLCEPVKAGQVMGPGSAAWNDLQDGIHPFGAGGVNDLAPPGLVKFVNGMQDETWPLKPLSEAQAKVVNGHLAALKAALDDPDLWAAIGKRWAKEKADWEK